MHADSVALGTCRVRLSLCPRLDAYPRLPPPRPQNCRPSGRSLSPGREASGSPLLFQHFFRRKDASFCGLRCQNPRNSGQIGGKCHWSSYLPQRTAQILPGPGRPQFRETHIRPGAEGGRLRAPTRDRRRGRPRRRPRLTGLKTADLGWQTENLPRSDIRRI